VSTLSLELGLPTEPAGPEVAAPEPAPPLRRMAVAVIAVVGFFLSAYMLLYKLGMIGELTCGAGSCDRVQASQYAVFLGVPVPLWGVLGYALIFGLAFAGLHGRLLNDRRVAAALVATTGAAFAFSMYLTYLEAFVIHAWCRWCVVSALLATALFVLALPELRRARREQAHG
jgi:uncharacterized membrane protein